MDGSALLFTTLASVATGLIFGLAPAFRASRTDVAKSLNEGDRGTEGFGRNRLRSVLAVVYSEFEKKRGKPLIGKKFRKQRAYCPL